MKILITGGAGFIGSHLTEFLRHAPKCGFSMTGAVELAAFWNGVIAM